MESKPLLIKQALDDFEAGHEEAGIKKLMQIKPTEDNDRDEIRALRCPCCGHVILLEVILKPRDINIGFRTDGKKKYPARHEPLPAINCPSCSRWNREEHWQILHRMSWFCERDGIAPIRDGHRLSVEEIEALMNDPAGDGQEKTLRLLLWQALNDQRMEEMEKGLRYGTYLDDEVMHPGKSFSDNLNALKPLLQEDAAEDLLLLAESCREGGDFAQAQDLLKSLDSHQLNERQKKHLETISANIEAECIIPLQLGCMPLGDENVPPDYLEGMIKEGFYPFPEIEDVFAFPSPEKENEIEPLLSVTKSETDEGSWYTFINNSDAPSMFLRHNRLFSPDEWEDFQASNQETQNALIEFWSYNSWNPPVTKEERDRYYSMLFRFKYGIEPDAEEPDETRKDELNELWKMIYKDTPNYLRELGEWVRQNPELAYWNFFWGHISGESTAFWEEELYAQYLKRKLGAFNRRDRRLKAYKNKSSLRLGGGPGWFQGLDNTPDGSNDQEFIGEIWSGDIGGCSCMLIYLFYDPADGRLEQTIDYD